MDKLEILNQCTVNGNYVKLPDVQLDRKLYLEVAKALELIGGKWKGGKIAAFEFKADPTDLLESIKNGDKRNLKKEFQFFETPSTVIKEMFEHLPDLTRVSSILEPSAGQGAIIRALNEITDIVPDCYELMDINVQILNKSNLKFNLLGSDFLQHTGKKYDLIVANPPFSNNQDIDHVMHMYNHLNDGGTLITIMSPSWTFGSQNKQVKFREFLDYDTTSHYVELPVGLFKESGTNIKTMLVVIEK